MGKTYKKFVALFDIHCGWNWMRRGGQRVLEPTHNEKALKATMDFVRDYQPDVFILGGDQLNCSAVSHWNRGRPKLVEGLRLVDDFDLLEKHVLSRLPASAKTRVWLKGNHEAWIDRLIEEYGGLEGLIEPAAYLGLKKRGFKIFEQGELYKLGKLYFAHGDIPRVGGKYPAQALASLYRRNIRVGHFHTWAVGVDKTPVDSKDYHTCVVVPALARRGPAYQKNAPDNFITGFNWGVVFSNGNFHDQISILNDSRFWVNGTWYPKKG